jgi:hypothetical protein
MMSDSPRLSTPRIHVVLDDSAVYDVQTHNPDLVAWDRERNQRKWPTAQDAPLMWLTYLAWRALKREGAVPSDTTFDAFTLRTLEVSSAQDDEVDPTQQEATLDSS